MNTDKRRLNQNELLLLFDSIPRNCFEYGGKTYESFFKKY